MYELFFSCFKPLQKYALFKKHIVEVDWELLAVDFFSSKNIYFFIYNIYIYIFLHSSINILISKFLFYVKLNESCDCNFLIDSEPNVNLFRVNTENYKHSQTTFD